MTVTPQLLKPPSASLPLSPVESCSVGEGSRQRPARVLPARRRAFTGPADDNSPTVISLHLWIRTQKRAAGPRQCLRRLLTTRFSHSADADAGGTSLASLLRADEAPWRVTRLKMFAARRECARCSRDLLALGEEVMVRAGPRPAGRDRRSPRGAHCRRSLGNAQGE